MATRNSKTATPAGSVPSVATQVAAAVGSNLSPLQQAFAAAKNLLPDVREVETVNVAGETVKVNVNDPSTWQEMGSAAAFRDKQDKTALNIARVVLKDAPYAVWMCFGTVFQIGASNGGYENPANLLHRVITAPLAAEGIVKPQSPTSSNARVLSDAAKAAAEAKAAAAKALTEMSDDDIVAELKEGKAAPERLSSLHGETARRIIAATKENAKAVKEAKSKARKALLETVDSMTTAEMQILQAYAMVIVDARSNKTALQQHAARTLDAADNKTAPKETAKRKPRGSTKH